MLVAEQQSGKARDPFRKRPSRWPHWRDQNINRDVSNSGEDKRRLVLEAAGELGAGEAYGVITWHIKASLLAMLIYNYSSTNSLF